MNESETLAGGGVVRVAEDGEEARGVASPCRREARRRHLGQDVGDVEDFRRQSLERARRASERRFLGAFGVARRRSTTATTTARGLARDAAARGQASRGVSPGLAR